MLDMVTQIDIGGNIQYSSPSSKIILGYKPEDMLGLSLIYFVHPNDWQMVSDAFLTGIANGAEGKLEVRFKHADRHYLWLEIVGKVLLDDRGAAAGVIFGSRDITERKRMEEELKYKRDFENLIMSISTGFINLNTEQVDDSIAGALKAIGEFLDVDRGYVIQFSTDGQFMDKTHEWRSDGVEPHIDLLKNLSITEFPWYLNKLKQSENIYLPRVSDLPPGTKDRQHAEHQKIKSFIAIPIEYKNFLLGFIGFDAVRDEKQWSEETITLLRIVGEIFAHALERARAEDILRQSEERFSRAFQSSPCAMSITRLSDNRIIDVNQRWQDTLGFSREEVVGNLLEDINIWAEQQRQQAIELVKKEYGSIANLDAVFRNKKGEELDTLWYGEIITLYGEPCLLGAWIDITERKKYEKEVARMDRLELMGQIAGGIAHEIRNPMTVVRGYLQMLQLNEEFASQHKRFDTMIGEIDRANAIITEFLSLAKDKPEEMKRQNINSIVTALVPLIQADAAKSQVAVSVDLVDVPDVNLDEKEIRQVVLNLVRNGLEAMPQAGKLTIKTSKKKDRVILSINDRGNGIPPEVLEKLGTPFFTTKDTGTGLGLSICYRIAESHNARIEIKTGKRGTTFMVSFPMSSV
jgi:two-component system, sporulation sensor kinase E